MEERDYSDDYLMTNENLADVSWDTLESGGLVSEGQHLAVVKKISGYLFNFQAYSGPRAKVMFQIVDGPDKGKTQFDDISLPHAQESQGTKNRRILIASRMGLIEKGSKDTAKVNWKILEGAKVLITVEHNVSKTNGKTYSNVTFDGWADPAAAPTPPSEVANGNGGAAKDTYADI